ncbi:DNA repair family protein [Cordyceps fumosorosea ARSEF 2679]|uniref:DNA repair family protein n=1 Tax=Cordyceps fumosorosea (strain ARSEF 2679) TaxID=1081104 RepID=A0A167XHX8_CORFA|nr:DNA repair family protein [Cordyceps fumosorosea ARSEF 2679]OAA64995.1 DNA repair family protein [Cordyceps fumosorosea ARSEF 2679]
MPEKRTLDAFFAPTSKKPRECDTEPTSTSKHSAYPFDIADLPASLAEELLPPNAPTVPGQPIDDKTELDLVYFDPFVPKPQARQLFEFLRAELPFYRVRYKIKRGGIETDIRTPRWTTVFGLDETSRFKDGCVVDAKSQALVADGRYDRYPPRPIPQCLDTLRRSTEAATSCRFNFCLVNYYASGADSISYHSDDERFLGPDPAIASFSLGAQRDFLMKHKTAPESLKLALASGAMVLMRGTTQSRWLHSIPKRTGKNSEDGGRINITFRRAMTKDGTENYYNYNVGRGPVHRWDKIRREMRQCNK